MSKFDENSFPGCYLLNGMMDSGESLFIVSLQHNKELNIFWRPSPYFQGHNSTLKCQIYTQIAFPDVIT